MSTGSWITEEGTGVWVQDPAPVDAPSGATTSMDGFATDFGIGAPSIDGASATITVA